MRRSFFLTSLFSLAVLASACGRTESPLPRDPARIDAVTLEGFAPLPNVMASASALPSRALVDLGRMLYYEKRLSKGQDLSCNGCHDLAAYGVDGRPTSNGHRGQKGNRNAPTVYNAAAHVAQFWDGRARDVEEQAKGPVMNPVEMAMVSEKAVVDVLESMPRYVAAFSKAFPAEARPVTFDNVGKAIGAFERGLVTPSRWDAFLKGDRDALTREERIGLNMFMDAGCQSCHGGTLVGGATFQKLGVAKPFPRSEDPGRFAVTGKEVHRAMFKVPSLRNVEKTAPYFHDGKTATLAAAVRDMGEYQLAWKLTDPQVSEIVAFLRTLTGNPPTDYIKEPGLPPRTARTPKADPR